MVSESNTKDLSRKDILGKECDWSRRSSSYTTKEAVQERI